VDKVADRVADTGSMPQILNARKVAAILTITAVTAGSSVAAATAVAAPATGGSTTSTTKQDTKKPYVDGSGRKAG